MEYLLIILVILMLFAPKRAKQIIDSNPDEWIKYNFMSLENRPKESGKKYFVHRKDGKLHWETWNGTGFAYNNNSITHFRNILPPHDC